MDEAIKRLEIIKVEYLCTRSSSISTNAKNPMYINFINNRILEIKKELE
jgi:hypothetical protein